MGTAASRAASAPSRASSSVAPIVTSSALNQNQNKMFLVVNNRKLRPTSNPNSSTSSWEHPKQRVTTPENSKKEVNNNNIDKNGKSKTTRARSETNLIEDKDELENDPPQQQRSFDDRPAKASGKYSFQ
uniref:Uncharacterized protein n=1 Tax=Caenorhabditis japonica TaxID=281687 RepID=A0A8R1IYQ9_CAEJA